MYYSVCLPAVLGGKKIREALEAVRDTGYDHYEFWGWTSEDIDEYCAVSKELKLTPVGMCTSFEPLNDPSQRIGYVNGLRNTLEHAKKLGCKNIITQVGAEIPNVPRELQHASIVAGLRA